MKIPRRLLVLPLLAGFLFVNAYSQIYSPGAPIYNPQKSKIEIPQVLIEGLQEMTAQLKESNQFKDNQFAYPFEVDLNPTDHGTWFDFPQQNKRVWFLSIEVEDASSLHLVLSDFMLEDGVKLFFYDSFGKQVKGAITSRNNKKSKILPIAGITGNKLICEMQMPIYQNDFGSLSISKIGAGFPEQDKSLQSPDDEYFGKSQACQENVNCYSFEGLDLQKRSVCRIIFLSSKRCTGTLINNLTNDGTPYILTAAHCISDENTANEAIFYFNYESPDCSNTDALPSTISGAYLMSAGYHRMFQYDTLDFALLKLTEKPPAYFGTYYSGWDATNNSVDSTFMLHHPQGDIKKISIDRDPPTTGDFGNNFDSYTHWLIKDYEVGSSENGSSGAGLIDQDFRLIGTLSGGGAACSAIINDYYQKFHHAFDDYEDKDHQLKYWLDPRSSGNIICNGFDPSFGYRHDSEILYNYSDEATPKIIDQGSGYGYIAGHNYQQNYLFAERFSINGSKYLVGANLNFAHVFSSSTEQYVSLLVWDGGETPGNVIYEKRMRVSDLEDLYINYPNDYHAIEFDSTILVHNDFYFGFQIDYQGDTFALKTYPTYQSNNSAYTYIDGAWKSLQHDGAEIYCNMAAELYAFDLNVDRGVYPDTISWSDIRIYPNPATERIQVYFNSEPVGNVIVKLYNLNGIVVIEESWTNPGRNMSFELNVPSGVYFLHVISNGETTGKSKVLVF